MTALRLSDAARDRVAHLVPRRAGLPGLVLAMPVLALVAPVSTAGGSRASVALAALVAVLAWVLDARREAASRRWMEQELAERTEALRREKEQLAESTHADALTGLHNRRYLQERVAPALVARSRRLEEVRRRGQPAPDATAVLLLVDLDHFKAINDTYGHKAGDDVLVEVAARVRRVVRASDSVIRWGGDELLVVTGDTSPDAGVVMAERIRAAVRATPIAVTGGPALTLTCTVGFACFPFLPAAPAAGTCEDVVGIADAALYAAKRNGRGTWAALVAGPRATQAVFAQASHDVGRLLEGDVVQLRRAD